MKLSSEKILVILLFFTTTFSYGQFTWGMRVGTQFSTVHQSAGNKIVSPSWKTSYLIPGLFFDYQFDKIFAVSADAQFVNKGFTITNTAQPNTTAYNFHYLNSYILFHFRPVQNLSLFAGPEIGHKFSTMVVTGVERIEDNSFFKNRTDWGIAAGASYQFLPGYSIMARYVHGFENVTDPSQYTFTNRSVQLALSSTFHVPKEREEKKIIFGVHQGLALSTIYKLNNQDRLIYSSPGKKRVGYEFGVDVRFPIKKYFFVSTGAAFTQRGGSIGNDPKVKIDYFNVPLAIGISPIKTDVITVSLEGGLSVYWLLDSQNPYMTSPSVTNDDTTASYFYGFEVSTDQVKNVTLFLNLRKNFGAYFYRPNAVGYYSNANTISMGVRFRKKKGGSGEK